MIPHSYPSTISTVTGKRQMVAFFLSSVTGLQRWTDYVPVRYASFSTVRENSFDTAGAICIDSLASVTGKQAFVDYIPVFIDSAATDAWQCSAAGYLPITTSGGPLSLFAAGEQGGWWDPSDFSTMYQDAGGTTPVTSAGQPVGLLLDKSKGTALGVELMTDGPSGFTTTAGWVGANTTVSIVSGKLRITATATGTVSTARSGTYTDSGVGSYYALWTLATISGPTGGVACFARGGYRGANGTTPGTYEQRVLSSNTNETIGFSFVALSIGDFIEISSASVRLQPGNHRRQSTAASRPTLQQDASGYYYLNYDGVDDFMTTGSVDFSATNKMTVWAGINKASDAARGTFLGLGTTPTVSAGCFAIEAPGAALTNFSGNSGGTSLSGFSFVQAAPYSTVLTLSDDISAPALDVRSNAVSRASSAISQGTGNFSNNIIYFGRLGGTSNPFSGREYQTVIRGAASTAQQVSSTETFVGSKMGIVL